MLPYPSICVHLSLTPLRVDVINGWPIFEKLKLSHSFATTTLFRHTKLQSREDFPSSQIKVFMKKSSCKNTAMSAKETPLTSENTKTELKSRPKSEDSLADYYLCKRY